VTNLRLPGQYERLLGSVGLQGPYYNWNRWYLPAVGRYLELDPAKLKEPMANAIVGGKRVVLGVSGATTLPWYSYARGNPLTRTDPTGEYPGFQTNAPACQTICEEMRRAIQDTLNKGGGGLQLSGQPCFNYICNTGWSVGLGDSDDFLGIPTNVTTCSCGGKCYGSGETKLWAGMGSPGLPYLDQ
jgi:RHS repeat-associated protein